LFVPLVLDSLDLRRQADRQTNMFVVRNRQCKAYLPGVLGQVTESVQKLRKFTLVRHRKGEILFEGRLQVFRHEMLRERSKGEAAEKNSRAPQRTALTPQWSTVPYCTIHPRSLITITSSAQIVTACKKDQDDTRCFSFGSTAGEPVSSTSSQNKPNSAFI
jgi:hypothetical protein